VVSNGGAKWNLPPRLASKAPEFPPLTSKYGLRLLAWEEEGSLQRFRRELAPKDEDDWREQAQAEVSQPRLHYFEPIIAILDNFFTHTPPGGKLTRQERKWLEWLVDREPDPLWLRAILWRSYWACPGDPASSRACQRHALWIIEQFPTSSITAIVSTCFKVEEDAFTQAKTLWLKALECNPPRLAVIDAAVRFFWTLDRTFCGELLRKGKALDPDEPTWSGRLAALYECEFMSRYDESRYDWAAMTLRELLADPKSTTTIPGELQKPLRLATLAFEAGEWELAAKFARQILEDESPYRDSPYWAHDAHQMLGRVALRQGNIEDAKRHLRESNLADRDSPSASLVYFRMELAQELLERGEKEAVIAYLKVFSLYNSRKGYVADKWIELIEQGKVPDPKRDARPLFHCY
jgi:tetratricopeptide (TPR) repeat protein